MLAMHILMGHTYLELWSSTPASPERMLRLITKLSSFVQDAHLIKERLNPVDSNKNIKILVDLTSFYPFYLYLSHFKISDFPQSVYAPYSVEYVPLHKSR